jgi:hypothetical protein
MPAPGAVLGQDDVVLVVSGKLIAGIELHAQRRHVGAEPVLRASPSDYMRAAAQAIGSKQSQSVLLVIPLVRPENGSIKQ